MRLHITNGDSTVPGIQAFDPEGVVLPWRDILHEGPVPGGIGPDLLSEVRSTYLADAGYSTYRQVLTSFRERRDIMRRAREFDGIVLWFEHDLYDQLQIVEVLSGLRDSGPLPEVTIICIDSFPGVERFIGLGQLDNDQIASLFPNRNPISRDGMNFAVRAWDGFRRSDPLTIEDLGRDPVAELPFLAPALRRLLRELPDSVSGLSETESIILSQLTAGQASPSALFGGMQRAEPAPFLGDSSFWEILSGLICAGSPAVAVEGDTPWPATSSGFSRPDFQGIRLSLTALGQQAAERKLDFVRLNGIDRWLGGTHLTGYESVWRWDRTAEKIVRT